MLPELVIRGRRMKFPINNGGMGVGISGINLSSGVTLFGGFGVLSGIFPDRVMEIVTGQKLEVSEAISWQINEAKKLANDGPIGINFMNNLGGYVDSVIAAIKAGIDFVFVGAGLPLNLPEYAGEADVGLIPIVSSVRALDLIIRKWKKYNRLPDAVVLEGPKAGGHLGFKLEEIFSDAHTLEKRFAELKKYIDELDIEIPIIVAGGIFNYQDVTRWLELGASGVQLGTRFLTTQESGASKAFKQAVVACRQSDIVIAHHEIDEWIDNRIIKPGSPAMHPFRVIKPKKFLFNNKKRCINCPILKNNECLAKEKPQEFFCIGNMLMAAYAGEGHGFGPPIYTVGENASRITKIQTVAEVMAELTGQIEST